MILKKPYAFFIKMFKPIHLILTFLIVYLVYFQNKIAVFLNSYIYSSSSVVGQDIKSNLASSSLYIIPLVIIVLSLIILGVMFRKEKPITFYVINIFAFVFVIVINIYTSNFLGVLEKSIVSIKTVKLVHDLVLINIGIESVSFIFFIIRGMGVNFKKFNFDSEISKFDINESDMEEFEVDINVDLNESKRKRRKKLRYLKYTYKENKLLINSILVIAICIIAVGSFFIVKSLNSENKEGIIYPATTFSFGVNETLLLNSNYQGQVITDNYLVVVNTKIKSNFSSNSLYLKDFSLKIGEAVFKPIVKYSGSLIDIGNLYDESILSTEYTNYLFVYEIPEKYITSEMIFSYNDKGISIDISLNPKELITSETNVSKNITDYINFENSLGNIEFKINDFEIKDKFLIEYSYCVNKNDCVPSKEYLKPSIDTNFDKYIMRLSVDYADKSDLNINSFYKFFSKFGSIYYNINGTWYSQKGNFEEIKSSKSNTGNNVYIGINSNIINAEEIKFVFDIRGSIYQYVLK